VAFNLPHRDRAVALLYSGGARSWLQAAAAITGRYLLGLLPMGGVPFTALAVQAARGPRPAVRLHAAQDILGNRSMRHCHREVISLTH
jgi:hypothetical protein